MNQQIQFRDDFVFDATNRVIRFTAMVEGLLTPCFIKVISTNKDTNKLITLYQFDWEEEATELIENESHNEKGEIWLKALN